MRTGTYFRYCYLSRATYNILINTIYYNTHTHTYKYIYIHIIVVYCMPTRVTLNYTIRFDRVLCSAVELFGCRRPYPQNSPRQQVAQHQSSRYVRANTLWVTLTHVRTCASHNARGYGMMFV